MKLVTTQPHGGNALLSFRRRRIALGRRFDWMHARTGGGPVLRGESSWRTVCGFVIQGDDSDRAWLRRCSWLRPVAE
jgi:hypothetical protein